VVRWSHSGMAALMVVGLLGCSSPAAPGRGAVPQGSWGGDHVALEVDAAGAGYELDCAHGRMESPLRLDEAGHFEVEGFLVPEGGPTREGPEPSRPAAFSGSGDGRRLSFSLTLLDSGDRAGPFTVILGEAPRLFKCL
jgi:hypothetical protein